MEKLSLELFNNNTLPTSKLNRITGGAVTGAGSKTVNDGHPSSASVSWTSDDTNPGGTTLYGYNRTEDSAN